MADMIYRRLGRAGLKVSVLSFGSWVTFNEQLDDTLARDCIEAALEHGSTSSTTPRRTPAASRRRSWGVRLHRLGLDTAHLRRVHQVLLGDRDVPNMHFTLNRKYLMQAIDRSLERFGLDFLDLVYCHRSDPETPIEETVWAMSDMITQGKALYWGTSEWSADEIRAAYEIAQRHHLHKPVVEQPEYNLFNRRRVEKEYARLYEDIGLGTTIWSPLASGLLTGKYLDGVPEGRGRRCRATSG
jgi:aryl-alcohol dehydrogenase-like predicted oxidoreductase